MSSRKITLTHPRILEFYESRKLDPEEMNLLFIDLLDRASAVAPTDGLVTELLAQIKNVSTQVAALHDATATTFAARFMEFKREYLDDMRMLFSNHTAEKIAPLLEKQNEILQDKTKILLNDILPRGQDTLAREIQSTLRDFTTSIRESSTTLAQTTLTRESLTDFIATIEDKFSTAMFQSQTLLNSTITNTEQRLQTQMTDIRDNCSTTQIQTNLSELIRKMEGSTKKGEYSENLLYNIILTMYPTAQVEGVGRTKETGDIVLFRKNRPKILIENKNYARNVSQDEVDKFYRDIDEQDLNGIFLSQKTGIVNKNNYDIEIHNNNVLVYIHNVNYDADKIKAAINIIDHIRGRIDELAAAEEENAPEDMKNKFTIDKHMLDQINIEYRDFTEKNLAHIKSIKEMTKRLVSEAEAYRFPTLDLYLSKKYSAGAATEFVCACGFIGKNLRALAAHQKRHKEDEYAELVKQDMTL